MSTKPRVYIDANVFAYELIPYTKYRGYLYYKSHSFFLDIASGKYEGVTSTLTALEYRAVAKKVVSDSNNNVITANDESTAMSDFSTFLNSAGIGVTDSDKLSVNNWGQPDLFTSTDKIVEVAQPIYTTKRKPQDNPWRTVGGTDGLMVNLAIRAGAQYLATFDRAFSGLNNPKLQPIIVQDNY